MKLAELARTLKSMIQILQPLFIWGPPGIGKSDSVRQAGKALGRPVIDIRAVLLDPVDLRGLPRIDDDGRTIWAPPGFLPRDPDANDIIFLDETCQEDRTGAHRLISSLGNRFLHIDAEVSVEDWIQWAISEGLEPSIPAYINWKTKTEGNSKALFNFEPETNPREFPIPRSWHFVSKVIGHAPKGLEYPVVAGCVGKEQAAQYIGFRKIWKRIEDPRAILANPTGATVHADPALQYATIGGLAHAIRGTDNGQLEAYATYAERLTDEFTAVAMRDGCSANRKYGHLPAVRQWAKENKTLLGVD